MNHDNRASCLLVEDDADMRGMVNKILENKGMRVVAVNGILAAAAALKKDHFSLCVLDLYLKDGDGMQFLEHLKRERAELPVIIITSYGDIPTAVDSIKKGAVNFINKPLDVNLFYRIIEEALAEKLTKDEIDTDSLPLSLIGGGAEVKAARKQCLKWRDNRAPICISGAHHSGRHSIVEFIHKQSSDNRGTLYSHSEINDIRKVTEWKKWFESGGIDSSDKHTVKKQSPQKIGLMCIDELTEAPAQIWKMLGSIARHFDQDRDDCNWPRLAFLTTTPFEDLEDKLSDRARDTLLTLPLSWVKIPPLSKRAADCRILLNTLIKRHAKNVRQVKLLFTGKTQQWFKDFSRSNELIDLENYFKHYLGSFPDGDKDKTINFSVPDLKQQDFVLLHTLQNFRWNRTRAARALGMTLRQIRYRLSKLGL